MTGPSIAVAHDYLTQRGGAERVVLSLLDAFPGAPLHTSLYEPSDTFPEFQRHDVRPLPLNRLRPVRADHRLGLPLFAPAFSRAEVDADVVVCSSSGWAHGIKVRDGGRKVVYCHNPARWLYQTDQYLRDSGRGQRALVGALRGPLERWDRRAAASADRYLVNSSVVAERVQDLYGIEATVVPPPPALVPGGEAVPVAGVEPGFLLCVSRLLVYKNLDAVLDAVATLPEERLVIVGRGPDARRLQTGAPSNVTFVDFATDAQLRWLYASCDGLVSASHEDYGLTPLEAAAFGKPVTVLEWGGFLDTVDPDATGVFFPSPTADAVRAGIVELRRRSWSAALITAHADRFSEAVFQQRLRTEVAEVAAG
jgi:glycosyltransferase involved in cell wall biosynthesis